MKKLLYFFTILLIFLSFASFLVAGEVSDEELSYKMQELPMEQASTDILGNIDFWLNIHNEVDGESGESWLILLGDKLPSQPIGVINVLAALPRSSRDVDDCYLSGYFFEDTPDENITKYNERSLAVLESFIMVDPEKERIRKACLKMTKESIERQKNIREND